MLYLKLHHHLVLEHHFHLDLHNKLDQFVQHNPIQVKYLLSLQQVLVLDYQLLIYLDLKHRKLINHLVQIKYHSLDHLLIVAKLKCQHLPPVHNLVR